MAASMAASIAMEPTPSECAEFSTLETAFAWAGFDEGLATATLAALGLAKTDH